MKIRFLAIAGLSLFLAGTSALAQSVEIFEELDDVQAQLTPNEFGVMHRHVRLKKDLAQSFFKGEELTSSLTFELKPGTLVTFRNSDMDGKMARRTKVWSGRAEGPVDGSATLVYRRKGIIGHLQIGAETYRISPGKDGIHMISVINMQDFPDEGDDMLTPEQD